MRLHMVRTVVEKLATVCVALCWLRLVLAFTINAKSFCPKNITVDVFDVVYLCQMDDQNAHHGLRAPSATGGQNQAFNARGCGASTEQRQDQKPKQSSGSSAQKSKKRKRHHDLGPGAPRQPVNGYVRFLNERREQVRASNPSLGFADVMKIMAQEWTQLPAEEKQKYMQAAEQDRQRYQKELQDYQQTEAYKSYVQQQQQQHVQQQLHLQQQQQQRQAPPMQQQAPAHAHQPQQQQQQQQQQQHHQQQQQQYMQQLQAYNPQLHIVQHLMPGQQQQQQILPHQQHGDKQNAGHRPDAPQNQQGVFDIPIFTEEFLDHNKVREAELRQLRKAAAEYEEQNAALRKHVETLQAAVSRLESETDQQRRQCAALQHHLDNLRDVLTNSFSHLPLPGYNDPPTMQTVDNYMAHLRSIIQDGSPENAALIAAARDIITRLNYPA